MERRKAVAEGAGGRDQNEDNREGIHAVVEAFPHALPVQALIDIDRDDQGVDDGDGSGFRRGDEAAHDTDHDDQDRSERPDRDAELL